MSLADLPAVNACLNALSAVFLGAGYFFIRRQNKIAHRNCMIAAFITSALFLVCYLTYHIGKHYVQGSGVTRFTGQGWLRPVYFAILISHTILAVIIVPLVLMTLHRAIKERFDSHRIIARWTWPLWMYVSVTGVLIYLMLYQMFPQR